MELTRSSLVSSKPVNVHGADGGASVTIPATRRRFVNRYFFVALALFYAAVAIGGFAPEMSGPVDLAHPVLAYVHGALMAAWLLLFIVQTGLAAAGLLKWHRILGLAAVGLAVAIWISMVAVSFAQLSKFRAYDVLLTQLMVLVLFALFFVWGILVRRQAMSHKRLMTLSTLVLLQPAIDRMAWLPDFGLPEYWPHAVWLLITLIPLVLYDALATKRIHPATLVGSSAILATDTIISLFWTTPGWLDMARAMTSAID